MLRISVSCFNACGREVTDYVVEQVRRVHACLCDVTQDNLSYVLDHQ